MGRDKKLLDATKKHLTKEEKEKKMKEEEVLYNYIPLDFSKVPKWLNKTAKKEWKRIGIYLTELPISELDRKSVELYCYYCALIEEAGKQLNEEPMIVLDKRKEELAEIADVDEPLFIEVDYKVETRIGKIMFSNELIEDAAVNVVDYSKKQMKRMVKNTNNKNILAILSKFTATVATDTDGLKNVINVQLDPELDIKLLVNQDAYNYLDTLKDVEGRYLLQPSLSAPSGKQFAGHDVIVVSNKVAPTPKDTVGFIFIGDLEEACILFKRKEITAEWEKFDSYSKGLAVGVRSDYKQVDPEAGFVVNLNPVAEGEETPQTK